MRHTVKVLGLALLLAATGVQAQSDKGNHSRKPTHDALAELRPSGPITVKADRAEWVQNNAMKYTGNVSMSSSTLLVSGDSMDVKQAADGQFEAWIHGAPAKLDHAPEPNAAGNAAQPVHAEAREFHYDSRAGSIDMNGDAHLKRGDDMVDGSTIGYIIAERRIRAAGGSEGGGQVTITFQPPPPKPSDAENKDRKP